MHPLFSNSHIARDLDCHGCDDRYQYQYRHSDLANYYSNYNSAGDDNDNSAYFTDHNTYDSDHDADNSNDVDNSNNHNNESNDNDT